MPRYITQSSYLSSSELLQETAQFCIPTVVGQVNPACGDIAFALSVEFFGQVYCKFSTLVFISF